MKINVNTQASVKLETAQGIIYFDPFRLKKFSDKADFIFITHSHFDHFSPRDIKKISKSNTVFVAPESMADEMSELITDDCRLISLSPFEEADINGIKIEAVPAYNTNKPMHKKEYGWLGYVVTVEDKRIYVCGDMDATAEGEKISCDIAFVPIGGTYTMNYKEAADFVNKMSPRKVIPYHYGSIVGKKSFGEAFKALVDSGIETELYI